jgi:hypothetical protein
MNIDQKNFLLGRIYNPTKGSFLGISNLSKNPLLVQFYKKYGKEFSILICNGNSFLSSKLIICSLTIVLSSSFSIVVFVLFSFY